MRCLAVLASLSGVLAPVVPDAAAQGSGAIAVDLELVIAVDVSPSMDAAELALQRNGYREAIAHPDFIAAVRAGTNRRIALTYVEWSGERAQDVLVPWRMIEDETSARAFAAGLDGEPSAFWRGTSVSAALAFSAGLFEANSYESARRVIDISGDGPNNVGPPVTQARDRLVAAGIVINGLPIVIDFAPLGVDLVKYYSECVVGGAGAFVLPVERREEFSAAIRQKLIREVAGWDRNQILPAQGVLPTDCLIGEKLRQRYVDPYFPGLDVDRPLEPLP